MITYQSSSKRPMTFGSQDSISAIAAKIVSMAGNAATRQSDWSAFIRPSLLAG